MANPFSTKWTANLAYAVGLITTDGCLSKDGRHITLVSKDIEQLKNFAKALSLKNKITPHSSGVNPQGKYYRIQFGNTQLYRFLNSIGLTARKTENIKELKIPHKYFAHFLRGHLDGDGCTYSYWDSRWKNSFQFYTCFVSLSQTHIIWIQQTTEILSGLAGTVRKSKLRSGKYMYRLEYAKASSIQLMKYLYPSKERIIFLKRKKFKIDAALSIIAKQAGVLKW